MKEEKIIRTVSIEPEFNMDDDARRCVPITTILDVINKARIKGATHINFSTYYWESDDIDITMAPYYQVVETDEAFERRVKAKNDAIKERKERQKQIREANIQKRIKQQEDKERHIYERLKQKYENNQ